MKIAGASLSASRNFNFGAGDCRYLCGFSLLLIRQSCGRWRSTIRVRNSTITVVAATLDIAETLRHAPDLRTFFLVAAAAAGIAAPVGTAAPFSTRTCRAGRSRRRRRRRAPDARRVRVTFPLLSTVFTVANARWELRSVAGGSSRSRWGRRRFFHTPPPTGQLLRQHCEAWRDPWRSVRYVRNWHCL